MATTVTVTGDERVIRELRAKGAQAVRLKDVMRDVADYSERQITGVPVRTGRLDRSTRGGSEQLLEVRDDGFDLGSTVRYARFVFGGTKNMRARPPRINANAIARKAADDINRELQRA
jgi:hypothetical protein